jgi:hypothetical protein
VNHVLIDRNLSVPEIFDCENATSVHTTILTKNMENKKVAFTLRIGLIAATKYRKSTKQYQRKWSSAVSFVQLGKNKKARLKF